MMSIDSESSKDEVDYAIKGWEKITDTDDQGAFR